MATTATSAQEARPQGSRRRTCNLAILIPHSGGQHRGQRGTWIRCAKGRVHPLDEKRPRKRESDQAHCLRDDGNAKWKEPTSFTPGHRCGARSCAFSAHPVCLFRPPTPFRRSLGFPRAIGRNCCRPLNEVKAPSTPDRRRKGALRHVSCSSNWGDPERRARRGARIGFLMQTAGRLLRTGFRRKGEEVAPAGRVTTMARVGLALYLMLTVAAGPCWCCCTAGRLFAFGEQSPRPRCCDQHTATPGPQAPPQESAPDNPSPAPHDSCPCRETRPEPVAFTASSQPSPADSARSLLDLQAAEVGGSFSGGSPALAIHGQAPKECVAFPFHDPREVLRALHILRC